MSDLPEVTLSDPLAVWMIEAYETLKKARDLLAQLAPAAPLLNEIEELIERAEEPYPVSVQPEAGGQDQPPAAPEQDHPTSYTEPLAWSDALVPEHQRDELYDAAAIEQPTHALAEFDPPEQTPEGGDLDGPTDVRQALALTLVLCRLLLENNGMSASGAFVNEALSIVEELWGKVPADTRAEAEAHAADWEEKAGW